MTPQRHEIVQVSGRGRIYRVVDQRLAVECLVLKRDGTPDKRFNPVLIEVSKANVVQGELR